MDGQSPVFDDGVAAYQRGDMAGAWFAFWSLARKGDPAAQFNLSRLYQFGQGVERDLTQARLWIEAAARQGFAPAMFTLGQYHHLGLGVSPNPIEARRWYEAAAEAGYGIAQFNIGLMYETGLGGTRDLVAARAWYARAAEQEVERANEALARVISAR